jgi:hypothetical protein
MVYDNSCVHSWDFGGAALTFCHKCGVRRDLVPQIWADLSEQARLQREAVLKAFDAVAVGVPVLTPKQAFELMRSKSKTKECDCGGPAGHVPHGFYCRK